MNDPDLQKTIFDFLKFWKFRASSKWKHQTERFLHKIDKSEDSNKHQTEFWRDFSELGLIWTYLASTNLKDNRNELFRTILDILKESELIASLTRPLERINDWLLDKWQFYSKFEALVSSECLTFSLKTEYKIEKISQIEKVGKKFKDDPYIMQIV